MAVSCKLGIGFQTRSVLERKVVKARVYFD